MTNTPLKGEKVLTNYNTLPIIKQKFDSIDLMRGIAILMVILVHTSQKVEGDMFSRSFLDYGQMGVQLFFVASAFTLCYSFEIRRSTDKSLTNFYLRRYFRLAPGYYVGILLYFLLNLVYRASGVSSEWKNNDNPFDIILNMFFLNGLVPSANNSVVPGGWSIGTEMLFYLIFPLLFYIYSKLQRFKYFNFTMPILALALSLSIQFAFYLLTKNPDYFNNNGFIFFSIVNQLPVFCVGMSMYYAFKNDSLKNISTTTSILMFTILTILSSYLMVLGNELFTFIFAITPFISALSFLFLFTLLKIRILKTKSFLKLVYFLILDIYYISYSPTISQVIYQRK